MNKKTLIITTVSVLAIVGFLFGAYAMTSKPQVTEFPELRTPKANDHIKWSPDKKQVLVKYSDLQCPACQAYQVLLTELAQDELIAKNVTFVYRHFPLDSIHANARSAAHAAEAAGLQGKFFEMHDALFNKQNEWSGSNSPFDFYKQYAEAIELDLEQFEKDYNSNAVKQRVQDDMLEGNNFGVQGTPTFFFNGKKIDNPQTPEEFRAILLSGIEN